MARQSKKQSTGSVVEVPSNVPQTILNEEAVNPVVTEKTVSSNNIKKDNKVKVLYKAPSKTLQLSNFSDTPVSNNILI